MLGNHDEAHRRMVNAKTDKIPSFGHHFNAALSYTYVKNKTVLDIGCWTGQMAQLLAHQSKKYIGVDPGSQAIALAQKMVKNARFVVGTADSITFQDHSFDTVLLLDVIEHVPKGTEDAVYKKVNKLLKAHGTLILTTPSAHPLSILLDPAYFLFGHRHYHSVNLVNSLRKAGFHVGFIIKTGTLTSLLIHNVELLLKHFSKKDFALPLWAKSKIVSAYEKNGFAEIHIVATKAHAL